MMLHTQISAVTLAAVAVDADAERFPDNWLFKFRWGKGKKKAKEVLFTLVSRRAVTLNRLETELKVVVAARRNDFNDLASHGGRTDLCHSGQSANPAARPRLRHVQASQTRACHSA